MRCSQKILFAVGLVRTTLIANAQAGSPHQREPANDDIIMMLNLYVRNPAILKIAKEIWEKSFLEDEDLEEWSFIIIERTTDVLDELGEIIRTDTEITGRNPRTDHSPNSVEVDFTLDTNEILLGQYHTHPYLKPLVDNHPGDNIPFAGQDAPFSAADIWNFLSKKMLNYVSIVETKHKRFALVLTDPLLANDFVSNHKKVDIENEMGKYVGEENEKHKTDKLWFGDKMIRTAVFHTIQGKGLRFYETLGVSKKDFVEVLYP